VALTWGDVLSTSETPHSHRPSVSVEFRRWIGGLGTGGGGEVGAGVEVQEVCQVWGVGQGPGKVVF
jgi:hypothetical protein